MPNPPVNIQPHAANDIRGATDNTQRPVMPPPLVLPPFIPFGKLCPPGL